jgi:DNA-binding NarL/FixJ family response regulator/putative methionine-R-sulfoxide reductase with GAF domain
MKPDPIRVLVVDDERFFREAIRELLEGDGIEVRLASTASEALEAAEDPSIGVAVLDIQLPDQSGLTVLRVLRERRPALRVVMLSAHTDQEYVLEALRLGACDYLAKPLHEEEVKLSVRRALEAFEMASSWNSLRGRLGNLATEIESLVGGGQGNDRESLGTRAVEAVARLLDAGKTSLLLRDEGEGRLRVTAATGRKLTPHELDSVGVGEGVAGRAVAQGEAIVVDDVGLDPRFAAAPGDRYDSNSFVVMPLGAGQGRFGALCATDRRGGQPFAEEDVALLRLLSLTLAPWLDPTQPLLDADLAVLEGVDDDTTEAAPLEANGEVAPPDRDSELARRVCDAMTREVEPPRVLGSALRAVAECLGAAPVSVYLLESESGLLRREAQWEADGPSDREVLIREAGLTGAAFESGQAIACAAPAADPRFDASSDTPEGRGAGPLLVVPLRFRGRTLGVCRIFTADPNAASPRTAEVLGAALSAAVRNVLLYRSLIDSIEEVARARKDSAEAQ